jgi:hypothetical protein
MQYCGRAGNPKKVNFAEKKQKSVSKKEETYDSLGHQ